MVRDELELLNRVVDIVLDLDPDIIIGWDVQNTSWGYLNARALYYGMSVSPGTLRLLLTCSRT
jgi:DNA polymerase zeta